MCFTLYNPIPCLFQHPKMSLLVYVGLDRLHFTYTSFAPCYFTEILPIRSKTPTNQPLSISTQLAEQIINTSSVELSPRGRFVPSLVIPGPGFPSTRTLCAQLGYAWPRGCFVPSLVIPGPEFQEKKNDFKLYFIVLQLLISHLGNERHKRF